MSDFVPNHLGFDVNGFMKEFLDCLEIAVDKLSMRVIAIMKDEIETNGNGSFQMRKTAAAQVHEISREITPDEVELVVGIEEDQLGSFTDQVFVRTMVVLHGNVTNAPLMTKPGQMTWTKNVNSMHLSPPMNKDGTPRKPRMMPKGFMQFEKVSGFGAERHMLDNILNKKIDHLLSDFNNTLEGMLNSIDYSKYLTGG